MDLDCIGSIALAKHLYPGYVPVRSGLIHPVARNLYNLYKDHLGFITAAELKGRSIENMIVVDTRAEDKIEEYTRCFDSAGTAVEVFDHHPSDGRDIPSAVVHESPYGANTTALCLEITKRSIPISAEDATIALTGIYADTGNFLHENVGQEDFEAAAFLLRQGASLSLIKDFLVPLREKHQIVLFHDILNGLETRSIRGHNVQVCYKEFDEDNQGLGAVVEKVFEVENGEILFGFFYFPRKEKLLIIARNACADLRLNEVLSDFGGGGHRQAAAATVKTRDGREVSERIIAYLNDVLAPAATARDIMTMDVTTLRPDMSLLDASLFFEKVSHTGAPVVDPGGPVAGFLTLRDIMKGRKAGQMKSPVKAFMTKKVISAAPETTVREIDEIFFQNTIGHLPIIAEGRLVGIVTRTDLLAFKRGERDRRARVLEDLGVEAL
jgi:tRNA nucleotidyltransferase (CCA-adding enzyme)